MKYDHKFTCQILLLHRNKGRNTLHFGHFEGLKTHCNITYTEDGLTISTYLSMMFRSRKIISLPFDEMCKVQILGKLESHMQSMIESGK
jgi:hypothetical protein